MQLQPFRRPNIIDAERTRDDILRHIPEIRELYAQRNRTLVFGGMAEYRTPSGGARLDGLVGYNDAHLNGSDFIATIAEPATPKPGDLHDWDKLVDGCLYIDRGAKDRRPYYYQLDGVGDWISVDGLADCAPDDDPAGHSNQLPEVVIAGLTNLGDMCTAASTHHARKSGGAK